MAWGADDVVWIFAEFSDKRSRQHALAAGDEYAHGCLSLVVCVSEPPKRGRLTIQKSLYFSSFRQSSSSIFRL